MILSGNMLDSYPRDHIPGQQKQPITNIASDSMGDTEPASKSTTRSVDLDFLLVMEPYPIIEFEIGLLRYVGGFAGHQLDAGSLLRTARYSIQYVGFVYESVIPQTW